MIRKMKRYIPRPRGAGPPRPPRNDMIRQIQLFAYGLFGSSIEGSENWVLLTNEFSILGFSIISLRIVITN